MRTIIFILLLSPFFSFSQNANVFIKLTDARALQIKGESAAKGFEKWLQATSIPQFHNAAKWCVS
jgi:Mg2+/Co2+ transporter CorB